MPDPESSKDKAKRLRAAALEAAARERLHPIAAGEIAGLREDGIEPTPDQVVWLDTVCRRFDSPSTDIAAAGEPVQAGEGVWLWPLTIQASRWYRRAIQWFDGDDRLEALTLAFALAHGRESGVFEYMPTAATAEPRIEQWSGELACTEAELVLAVNRVMHVDGADLPDAGDDYAKTTDADVVAGLVAECGGTPDQWERLCCREYIWSQMRAIRAQQAATAGSSVSSMTTRQVTMELQWALQCIREAHKTDAAEPQEATHAVQ